MIALAIARPGPVYDGLAALLAANPDIREIVHTTQAAYAWDFIQTLEPDLILIHATPSAPETTEFLRQIRGSYRFPVLAIVDNSTDRRTFEALGIDIVVIEGTPSSKLAAEITVLLKERASANDSESPPTVGASTQPDSAEGNQTGFQVEPAEEQD